MEGWGGIGGGGRLAFFLVSEPDPPRKEGLVNLAGGESVHYRMLGIYIIAEPFVAATQ